MWIWWNVNVLPCKLSRTFQGVQVQALRVKGRGCSVLQLKLIDALLARLPGGLHPAGGVNRVAEQAVARHLINRFNIRCDSFWNLLFRGNNAVHLCPPLSLQWCHCSEVDTQGVDVKTQNTALSSSLHHSPARWWCSLLPTTPLTTGPVWIPTCFEIHSPSRIRYFYEIFARGYLDVRLWLCSAEVCNEDTRYRRQQHVFKVISRYGNVMR